MIENMPKAQDGNTPKVGDFATYYTSATREKRVVLITNIFDDDFDGVGFDGVWLDAPASHVGMSVWGRIENIEAIKNPTP